MAKAPILRPIGLLWTPLRLGTALASTLALAFLAWGCANPTTAYHRQFDYHSRKAAEATSEGRLEDAYRHLADAAGLASYAAAGDLEFVDVLTRLGRVARRTGRSDEALERLTAAGAVLARYREREGPGGWSYPGVAGSYLLESARLSATLGDLVAAEASANEFFQVRGRDGGDERESAEAHWLLGELLLGRDLVGHAREEFHAAQALAPSLARKDRRLWATILLRGAETEVARGNLEGARSLVEQTRPDGIGLPELRPEMLLVLARLDVAEGNAVRAKGRLDEALGLLAGGVAPGVASLGRAASIASLVFDAKSEAERLDAALDRSVELVAESPPLGALLLGRALIDAGREWIATGERTRGVRALDRGRQVIEESTRGRAHVALVASDFEIALVAESLANPEVASKRCEQLQTMAEDLELSESEQEEHTQRLLACGRIGARRGHAAQARKAFLAVLERGKQTGDVDLEVELLVWLAALEHLEERQSAETKLFERVLPLLDAGRIQRLPDLLVDAYEPMGWTQPSSAAARMAHKAMRTPEHQGVAEALQAISRRLSDADEMPANAR